METKFYITDYPSGPYLEKEFTPWKFEEKHVCSKCGLTLEPVMGYVCSNLDCPTGLGPVTCSSI